MTAESTSEPLGSDPDLRVPGRRLCALGDLPGVDGWIVVALRRAAPQILREARRRRLPAADDEDLLLDVLSGAWASVDELAPDEDLVAWLMRIGVRWIREGMGRRVVARKGPPVVSRDDPAQGPLASDAPATLVRAEFWDRLGRALEGLPCTYRPIVEALYLEGRTQEDLAQELGLTVKAVERRAAKARRRLRAHLETLIGEA